MRLDRCTLLAKRTVDICDVNSDDCIHGKTYDCGTRVQAYLAQLSVLLASTPYEGGTSFVCSSGERNVFGFRVSPFFSL